MPGRRPDIAAMMKQAIELNDEEYIDSAKKGLSTEDYPTESVSKGLSYDEHHDDSISIEASQNDYRDDSYNMTLSKEDNHDGADPALPIGARTRVPHLVRAYEEGMMPPAHQRVYNGLRDAVGGVGKSGTIILQRVCEDTGTSRTNVLRIVKYLERYGFVRYEARPKQHCSFVEVLR